MKGKIPIYDVSDGIREIGDRAYFPVDVARVNNDVVRMALIKGEFHWHRHVDEDELFYVLSGKLVIQMREPYSDLELKAGQMAVMPKGVWHCPNSSEGSYVLMFEPQALKSKGD